MTFDDVVRLHYEFTMTKAKFIANVYKVKDAEDICHDTWCKLAALYSTGVLTVERFESQGHLRAYLYRMMVNDAISHYRRRDHRVLSFDALDHGPVTAADHTERTITTRRQLKRLDELPQQLRRLANALLDGLNLKEAATDLGVTHRVARNYAVRMRRLLQPEAT